MVQVTLEACDRLRRPAGAAFRMLKQTLEIRPVYHRLEDRSRVHVLLCWLTLLLIRVAENRTGQT